MALDLKPSLRQNLEDGLAINKYPLLVGLIAWLGEDFSLPAQQIFDPREEWPSVAVIGKQMVQARKASEQLLQKQARTVAITDIGRMNQDCQDQALRINQEVPLATEDFFFHRRSHVLCLARDSF
jgi:hypothetical protein